VGAAGPGVGDFDGPFHFGGIHLSLPCRLSWCHGARRHKHRPKAFRPPNDWSNGGQMIRIRLSMPRQASEPLTSRDIAVQLVIERAH
jgi:hypothetical protein